MFKSHQSSGEEFSEEIAVPSRCITSRCQLLLVSNPFCKLGTFPSVDNIFFFFFFFWALRHCHYQTAFNFNKSNRFYEFYFLFVVARAHSSPRPSGGLFFILITIPFSFHRQFNVLSISGALWSAPMCWKPFCGWLNMRKCKSWTPINTST